VILTQLRTATAEDHGRAETAMPSLDELADFDGYAWSLRALHGFFAAWEAPVFGALDTLASELSMADRRKLPLLVRDLDVLGIAPALIVCAPPGDRAFAIPRALGAMYVLEGSTLGGQVIQRQCVEPLGMSPDRGGAFYHGYGARTGPRWKAFGEVIEAHVLHHGDSADVIDGARGCFAALNSWLGRLEPLHHGTTATVHHG
jgi:heme oxygenase